jgi:flagellar assembly protein FliH
MSTDVAFSRVAFPNLGRDGHEVLDEQARTRGHAAGYAEGLRMAATRMNDQALRLDAEHAATVLHAEAKADRIVELLAAAVRALDERALPLIRDVEHAIVASAVDLAGAVIGAELGDRESAARLALRRALDHEHAPEAHTVRMHPDDLALIGADIAARTGVSFTADPQLARGDAMTEFAEGFLDARIDTALRRAIAALDGVRQ